VCTRLSDSGGELQDTPDTKVSLPIVMRGLSKSPYYEVEEDEEGTLLLLLLGARVSLVLPSYPLLI
jgi:hypothetical protein